MNINDYIQQNNLSDQSNMSLDDLSASLESSGATLEKPSAVEAGLRGFEQGLTLGFGDEINAALANLINRKGFKANLEESRKKFQSAQEAHPIISTVSDIAGSVAPSVVAGLATGGVGAGAIGASTAARIGATQGAKLGAKALAKQVGKNIAKGAAQGAVAGLGYSDSDNLAQTIGDVGAGAILGGALPATSGAFKIAKSGLAKKGENIVKERLTDKIRKSMIPVDLKTVAKDLRPEEKLLLPQKAESIRNQAYEVLKEYNKSPTLKNMSEIASDLYGQKNKLLQESTAKVDNNKLLNDFTEILKFNDIPDTKIDNKVWNALDSINKDPSLMNVSRQKDIVNRGLSKARSLDASGQNIRPDVKSRLILSDLLNERLKSAESGIPDLNVPLSKLSTLHKVQPSALKKMEESKIVNLPTWNARLPFGENVKSGIYNTAGKIQNATDILKNIKSKIPEGQARKAFVQSILLNKNKEEKVPYSEIPKVE